MTTWLTLWWTTWWTLWWNWTRLLLIPWWLIRSRLTIFRRTRFHINRFLRWFLLRWNPVLILFSFFSTFALWGRWLKYLGRYLFSSWLSTWLKLGRLIFIAWEGEWLGWGLLLFFGLFSGELRGWCFCLFEWSLIENFGKALKLVLLIFFCRLVWCWVRRCRWRMLGRGLYFLWFSVMIFEC